MGHISPEAYIGGPISKIKDNDLITIDSIKNQITWEPNNTFNDIREKTENKLESVYLKKYRTFVSGAEDGCITF